MRLQVIPILNYTDPVHTLQPYFFDIHFNIILPLKQIVVVMVACVFKTTAVWILAGILVILTEDFHGFVSSFRHILK
jgi:hypothetical protein